MLTVAVIWCVIGALFGIPRARARFRRELAWERGKKPKADSKDIGQALFEAAIEQTKWTLLGVLSALSVIGWLLLEWALANQKELQKPGMLGPIGFSVLVFVLGIIALERRDADDHHSSHS